MREELEACPNPWCDEDCEAKPEKAWRVVCGCGVVSPSVATEAEAIKAWNTRPPEPAVCDLDLDALEKVARWAAAVVPGAWRYEKYHRVWDANTNPVCKPYGKTFGAQESFGEHIATFDPPTVLKLIAAARSVRPPEVTVRVDGGSSGASLPAHASPLRSAAATDAPSNLDLVRDFHTAFDIPILPAPTFPSDERIEMRLRILDEERGELSEAIADRDLVEVADALTDMAYLVYGTALEFGIDLNPCFREVHRSNMSKLGHDGKPILREDGKVMKGPNYSRPVLAPLLSSGAPTPADAAPQARKSGQAREEQQNPPPKETTGKVEGES